MHDEDCCENCMFFVKEVYARSWRTAPANTLCQREIQEAFLAPSYCRKSHTRTPKDKAEWCGEYKAKD